MAAAQVSSSSSSLLALAKQRDPEAWRRLTLIYGPTVLGWCRRQGLQSADAADIVQQVFFAVAGNIQLFHIRTSGDSFRGWLWSIFHSKLMDFYRERCKHPDAMGDSRVKRMDDAQVAATTSIRESSVEDVDSTEIVHRALEIIKGDFREPTWQAFWRSAALGEPTSQIAEQLGISSAAVCMCRSRVLCRLRETLEGLGVTPDVES